MHLNLVEQLSSQWLTPQLCQVILVFGYYLPLTPGLGCPCRDPVSQPPAQVHECFTAIPFAFISLLLGSQSLYSTLLPLL